MTKTTNDSELNQAIINRLDALIRLFSEMSKPENKRKLGEGDIARYLKSLEISPTEIAKILGKESATDLSYALYPKDDKKGNKTNAKKQKSAKQGVAVSDTTGKEKTVSAAKENET